MKNTFLFLLGVAVLPGCATITQGTKQNIHFGSVPAGAICDISQKPSSEFKTTEKYREYNDSFRGETTPEADANWRGGVALDSIPEKHQVLYTEIVAPASLEIGKSGNILIVSCQKEGYKRKTIGIAPRHNSAQFGNIIAGGGFGIILDAASGAAFFYPDQIVVELGKH